jgi:hypothetical protein
MGEKCVNVSMGKQEEKGLIGRARCRCEDNIKMYLKERGWEAVDRIHLVQDRDKWRALAKAVMSFLVP